MKAIVATSDGHCRLLNPMIACPLVQPPAYRVPKPTRNPPDHHEDETSEGEECRPVEEFRRAPGCCLFRYRRMRDGSLLHPRSDRLVGRK